MPVDDNGFMLLKTAKHQTAFLRFPVLNGKSLFHGNLCKKGKLELLVLVEAMELKKSSGTKCFLKWDLGICWEFPMGDDSWEFEMNEFYRTYFSTGT